MLVLRRREGESLRIGDEITVTVLSVQGGQVRLGVSAPRELPVRREATAEGGEAGAAGADDKAPHRR